MKKLLIYLRDYKKESILAPAFKMLEATFDLLVPLVMAAIINTGIANKDKGYILSHCGLLILLGVIGLTCSITAQYFAAKASVGFCTKVRHVLFSHIQSLGFAEMDKLGTSTLITRMTSDINQVQTESVPETVPEIPVYCVRKHCHGIYRKSEGGCYFCCNNSVAFHRCLWHYVDHDATLPEGTGQP